MVIHTLKILSALFFSVVATYSKALTNIIITIYARFNTAKHHCLPDRARTLDHVVFCSDIAGSGPVN
jgi:hypothetical protein